MYRAVQLYPPLPPTDTFTNCRFIPVTSPAPGLFAVKVIFPAVELMFILSLSLFPVIFTPPADTFRVISFPAVTVLLPDSVIPALPVRLILPAVAFRVVFCTVSEVSPLLMVRS